MSSAVDYVQLTHAASEIDGTIDEVYAARGPYGNLSLKIASKQDVITSESKLSSDLIDDTGAENLFVSASDKSAWSGKQDPATTLSGYGITDAYTKAETDTALSGKQGTLSQAQLAAANSGITAEKLTADEAALAEVVDNGAKNHLDLYAIAKTESNVTFAINSDKTISVTTNGAASAQVSTKLLGNVGNYVPNIYGGLLISGVPNPDKGTALYVAYSNNGTSQEVATTLRDGETTIIDGAYPYIQIFIIVYSGSNIGSTPVVFKPMICTKAAWDVSHAYEPYAISNPVITPALIEQVDNGAKNLLQLFQLGSSNANTGNPCTSQGVEYEIQSNGTITAYRKSSASSGAYIFLYKNGAIQNVSEFFDGKHIWSGNPPQYPDGGVSIWYRIGSGSNITLPNGALLPNANGEAVQIGFQISTALSPTQSNPIVFKPMICTASDWAISQKFVPYCPSMAEMYAMILALQNGTRSAPALAKAEPEEINEPETREEETR